jgi:hypothetical protein
MEDTNDYNDYQNPEPAYGDHNTDAVPVDKKPEVSGDRKPTTPAKPAAPPAKAAGKVPANGEVTILGYFYWKPSIDGKTEIDYLINGKWHPGFEDFKEIAGTSPTAAPGDFIALLGMLMDYAPGSISRLNFFTHADSDNIGITGYMTATDVLFTSWVSDTDINNTTVSSNSYTYINTSFTLDDVRKRFAKDAIFVLYGCKAGFDPTTLLTSLKDLLQITVIGFKEKIVFCPPSQTVGGSVFVRKGEKMGVYKSGFDCAVDATKDWRSLITNSKAVKI